MTLPNANYRQSTKAQVFCLAVILMLGSVIPVWSNDGSSYLGQLQQLVRLAENSRNKAQVFDQLEQLQKLLSRPTLSNPVDPREMFVPEQDLLSRR